MEIDRASQFPTEVLENIFRHVDVSDVPSIAATCRRFNSVLESSNKVWRSLFGKRFPRLMQQSCDAEVQLLLSECGRNWRTLFQRRLGASFHLRVVLDCMANRYFMLCGLPDLAMEKFRKIAASHGSLVMRDALLDEIFYSLPQRGSSLSRSYYSTMLYREVQRDSVLLPLMRRFMALPPEEQTVGEAYHLLAMWRLPELGPRTPPDVDRYTARLAELVLAELKSRYPDHPVTIWTETRSEPLDDTLWTDELVQQVLECLNYTLYDRLQLLADEAPENPESPEDQHLHGTLQEVYRDFLSWGSGMEGVMTALYSAVAVRLGVLVELLRMTDSWMVRWQPTGDADPLFIDVMEVGVQLDWEEALERVQEDCPDAHHQMLLEPMAPGMMLNYLAAGGYERKSHRPQSEADQLASQLLLYRTMTGCDPGRLQLSPACALYEAQRPAYTRRLCQEYLRASNLQEDEVEEVRLYIASLRDRHDAVHSWTDDYEQKIIRYVPSACICSRCCDLYRPRLYVGDVVTYGELMAVVYGVQTSEPWNPEPTTWYHLLLDGELSAPNVPEAELALADRPRPVRHLQVGRYFAQYCCGRYTPLPYLQRLYPAPPDDRRPWMPAGDSDSDGVYTDRDAEDDTPPTAWVGDWPLLTLLETSAPASADHPNDEDQDSDEDQASDEDQTSDEDQEHETSEEDVSEESV